MTNFSSSLLKTLHERGYVHQITDESGLDTLAQKEIIPGYIGFDATASSLHVGSLVQIMMLRRLQQCGHKPIVIMGGGTTKIGDPTGRDESRKMLSDEEIDQNIASIRIIFEKFLSFGDGPTDAIIINNDDWLGKIEYLKFLRDIGPHFTINRMLTFDSVRLRLEREQPMTFLEFNYMIMQAYDFLELSRRYDCKLQMGGSDQWGNIVNGMELGRRVDSKSLFGLTTPLITLADGGKMGKTASGAVWLNEDMLSSYDYWQFWRNTQDADVGKFLRLFTDIDLDEIARLEKLEGSEINQAKIILANAATEMAHSRESALSAEQTASNTFEKGMGGGDLPEYCTADDNISMLDAMLGLGFVASKGEGKRLIKGGGAKVDGVPIKDEMHIINRTANSIKVSAGKKKHGILIFE